MPAAHDEPARCEKRGPVATVTTSPPGRPGAQDSTTACAPDRAFHRGADTEKAGS